MAGNSRPSRCFPMATGNIPSPWLRSIAIGNTTSVAAMCERCLRDSCLARPGVVQFRVRYVYPTYMNLSPTSVVSSSGALEAPVGTQAFVDLVCTEPVESAKIVVGDQPIVAQPTGEPNVHEASLGITQSGPYQIHLRSARRGRSLAAGYGDSRNPGSAAKCAMDWCAGGSLHRPAGSRVVAICATDDYGVTSTQLIVQINDQPVRVIALPSAGASRQHRARSH